ncbi:hypothetical protein [Streptomyces sp. NPDC059378]|uniref:hypothetical protein n=1 Tax=Streptomyces sp. NPDC059378 TaxID=3346815 RepID=UPI0036889068
MRRSTAPITAVRWWSPRRHRCGWTGFARYQVAPLTGRTTFAEALQIAASEPVGPAPQLKPKYVQYEDFRPARREHAPDAAP